MRVSSNATPLALKSPRNLADDVFVAVQVLTRIGDAARISLGRVAGQPHLSRGPEAEQMIAPRLHLESELFFALEIALEGLFAVVEISHGQIPLAATLE
jgi:hypothetical protein